MALSGSTGKADLTGKLEADVEIDASPEKFHHMFSHRPHHVHHTSSEKVQGCDLHEGDFGTPGSKICWKYFHDGKAKTAKQVVDLDHEKKSITLKTLEGDILEEYKSFNVTIQTSPKKDGKAGSIVHWTLEYEKLHEGIGHPESLLKYFIELSKDMSDYLVKET